MTRPFADTQVEGVFDAFDDTARPGLMGLRDLILDTAASDNRVGEVTEALRWGQPAYLTPVTKSGTTLRIAPHKSASFALYVHCQTTLMSDYTAEFPGRDRIDGKRAVLFGDPSEIDPMRHGWLISRALTYHL
ncbi:DUF1801 domain-containing protein [Sedimentitalea todarodis]|uniref:DUF1801 domain-containing protein n=1 Tax=Sedimentitalea todarodis TaxID=1631240 RepID=A0ABU3VDI8_9RHOB|nr:DUF1801 domain-containing protein [Sedimentitalea todarodis]MDU9004237.1 DUF1801 domain-containing protein [Sedimentitalea todarodis]